MVKSLSTQLLISAQRNNCVDIEKKQESKVSNVCQAISDPMSRRTCRCHQCLPPLSRLSNFIPFHRRPRSTPVNHSDPSVRPKSDLIKSEENIEHLVTQTDLTTNGTATATTPAPATTSNSAVATSSSSASASPMVVQHSNPSTANEKTNEWTASTPNSVISASGPPSVLAPITNLNSVPSHSPASANMTGSTINTNNTTTTTKPTSGSTVPSTTAVTTTTTTLITNRGLKRSATAAFDDLTIVEDDEREQHKQTYDFHRTDTFLQLPLKRFST